jgi:hypothetical protein
LACGKAGFIFWSSVGDSVARRVFTTRSSAVVWFCQTVTSIGVFTRLRGFTVTDCDGLRHACFDWLGAGWKSEIFLEYGVYGGFAVEDSLLDLAVLVFFFASTPLGWAIFSRSLRALCLCVRWWVKGLEGPSIRCFWGFLLTSLAIYLFCSGLSGLIFPGDSMVYCFVDLCVETKGTKVS